MPKLPSLKPLQIIKVLEKFGFEKHRQKGSHLILVKVGDNIHQPIVPMHSKAVKMGTLRSIIKQAGLTPEEFEKARLRN
jgi:predicted RNA binding protein YcfA (HicA-like mRNA interferase family)